MNPERRNKLAQKVAFQGTKLINLMRFFQVFCDGMYFSQKSQSQFENFCSHKLGIQVTINSLILVLMCIYLDYIQRVSGLYLEHGPSFTMSPVKGPVCRIQGQKWDVIFRIMFVLVYNHLGLKPLCFCYLRNLLYLQRYMLNRYVAPVAQNRQTKDWLQSDLHVFKVTVEEGEKKGVQFLAI